VYFCCDSQGADGAALPLGGAPALADKEVAIFSLLPQDAVDTLYRLLALIDEAATEADVKYVADGGTVLGAVRHGGLIPWDDDADLAVVDVDFSVKRDAFVAALARRGLSVSTSPALTHSDEWFSVVEDGSEYGFVEMYVMERVPADGDVAAWWRFRDTTARSYWPKAWRWDADVAAATRMSFGPLRLPVSAAPEAYLDRMYGAEWVSVAATGFNHTTNTAQDANPRALSTTQHATPSANYRSLQAKSPKTAGASSVTTSGGATTTTTTGGQKSSSGVVTTPTVTTAGKSSASSASSGGGQKSSSGVVTTPTVTTAGKSSASSASSVSSGSGGSSSVSSGSGGSSSVSSGSGGSSSVSSGSGGSSGSSGSGSSGSSGSGSSGSGGSSVSTCSPGVYRECVVARVCMRVRACVDVCTSARVRRACVRMRVRVRVLVSMPLCLRVGASACLRVCASARLRVCVSVRLCCNESARRSI
jgi:hypothetical protein